MRRTVVWLACVLLFGAACGGPSPRDQLARMGIAYGPEAFREAAEDGDLHVVHLFLESGLTAGEGSEALPGGLVLAAARGGSVEVLDALLAAGADPNELGDQGATALMAAAAGGHLEAARRLLDAGVAPDQTDDFDNTALLHAAAGSHPELVALLLEAGASPDRRTKSQGSYALGLAAANDDTETLARLLDAGAEIEMRDAEQGLTALAVAALKGSRGAVRLLLDRGANVEARDRDDDRPLMIAANAGHVGILRDLLDQGADPDARGKSGITALMFAALKGHEEAVSVLLEAGADPTLETQGRYSALAAARHQGHEAIVATLEAAASARGEPAETDRRWARFALYGDTYRTPPGWTAVDPFSTHDWYWGEYMLLGIDRAEDARTRRALLRDEATRSQVWLVRGPVLDWWPRLLDRAAPLDQDAGVGFTEHRLRTADGVEVDYLVIERGAEGEAPARRHLLGVVDLGGEAFVVDAGGPAEAFDVAAVESLLRSVRLQAGGGRPAPASPATPR